MIRKSLLPVKAEEAQLDHNESILYLSNTHTFTIQTTKWDIISYV